MKCVKIFLSMAYYCLCSCKGSVYFFFWLGKDYIATPSLLLVKRGIFFFRWYIFFRAHLLSFVGSGIFFSQHIFFQFLVHLSLEPHPILLKIFFWLKSAHLIMLIPFFLKFGPKQHISWYLDCILLFSVRIVRSLKRHIFNF